MPLTDEDFKYKIVNASATRLVIVTFELITDRIEKAKNSLKSENIGDFSLNIDNAKQFVNELICSLDTNQPIASDMADIYFFVNKLLVTAFNKKDEKYLTDAEQIINKLKDGLIKEVDDSTDNGAKASISETYMRMR